MRWSDGNESAKSGIGTASVKLLSFGHSQISPQRQHIHSTSRRKAQDHYRHQGQQFMRHCIRGWQGLFPLAQLMHNTKSKRLVMQTEFFGDATAPSVLQESAIKQHQEKCFGMGFPAKTAFIKSYEDTLSRFQHEKSSQQTSLKGSQNQLQIAERQLQEAEQRFQAVKAGALDTAKKKMQQASGNYFTERFGYSDARQWAALAPPARLLLFFRCDWSETAWRTYNLTLSCRVPFWVAGIWLKKSGR